MTLPRDSRQFRRCIVVQKARDSFPAVIIVDGRRWAVTDATRDELTLREVVDEDIDPVQSLRERAAC
jgi:hypothetical protein